MLPHFDFARMAQLAVGRHWPKATPAQRQALINEFRTLLVRTYSNSLTSYKNQTIDYKPLKLPPGDTDVTVKTVVNQPGGQPIPIDYSLEKTGRRLEGLRCGGRQRQSGDQLSRFIRV